MARGPVYFCALLATVTCLAVDHS